MTLASLLQTLATRTGADFSAESFDGRLRIQKVVYLLARLGHPDAAPYATTYGMYVRGPYSPTLTRDYFRLPPLTQAPNAVGTGHPAIAHIEPAIHRGLDFLEATATLAKLRAEYPAAPAAAKAMFSNVKPHLSDLADDAEGFLVASGL